MKKIVDQSYGLHEFIDLLIDPIVVIITFILGFVIANIQMKRREKRELNSLFRYFNLYLSNQKDSFSRQINFFKSYIESLENLKPYDGITIEFVIQPYEMLDVVDRARLIQSYKKQRIDANIAIKTLMAITFSKENINIVKEAHNNFINKQNNILEQWNLGMIQLNQLKIELLSIPKDEIEKRKELIQLNTTFNNLLRTESSAPKDVIEILIKPLIEYFREIYSEDHLNEIVLRILPLLDKLDRLYFEGENHIQTYKHFLTELNFRLEEKMDEFEKLIRTK